MTENNKQLSNVKAEKITNATMHRVFSLEENKEISVPENYSVQNALQSAYLILNEAKTSKKMGYRPVLEVCTRESIYNSLLEMVVKGLSPMKSQGYFIAYGNKLTFQESYMGKVARAKRVKGIKDIQGYCVYKDDEFEMEFDVETGEMTLAKYKPDPSKWTPENIIGAFAVTLKDEGKPSIRYMTIAQIIKAWEMGDANGNGTPHKNFRDQMAVKTVISNAAKIVLNKSDDSDLVITKIRSNDIQLRADKDENANKTPLLEEPIEAEYEEVIEDDEEVVIGNNVDSFTDPETGEIFDGEFPEQQTITGETDAPF